MSWIKNVWENPTKENLLILCIVWIVISTILLTLQWRSKRATGLPLAWLLCYSMIHLVAALVYTHPYYFPYSAYLRDNESSIYFTFIGFRVALIGLIAYLVGHVVAMRVFQKPPPQLLQHPVPEVSAKFPLTALLLGILSFLLIGPLMRLAPSLGSMGTSGTSMTVVAVFLFCCKAMHQKNYSMLLFWLASCAMFPAVTILLMGFASYGALAVINVTMFVFRAYRPKWLGVLTLLLCLHICLSLYVNWMSSRDEIRGLVAIRQSMTERIKSLGGMLRNTELFNPNDLWHLEYIDLRLNQNDLVGKAVAFLNARPSEYAQGTTIKVAMQAWIPRIIWPGKPKYGGSADWVSRFTGKKFADGVSVGIGQALEYYANWGYPSVIVGFFLYGFVVCFFDLRAGYYLTQGDFWSFSKWILPGLALINVGGNLAETVGSMAANTVFVLVLHHVFFAKYYHSDYLVIAAYSRKHRPNKEASRP